MNKEATTARVRTDVTETVTVRVRVLIIALFHYNVQARVVLVVVVLVSEIVSSCNLYNVASLALALELGECSVRICK